MIKHIYSNEAMVDESQIASSLLTGAGSWSAYYDSSSEYGLQSHIATPTINQISLANKIDYTNANAPTVINAKQGLDQVLNQTYLGIGVSGTFTTADIPAKTVTVTDGIITSIV